MGGFKGFIYNFAQFGLVLYPSVYLANKNGGDSKFFTFLSTYTFFDALFYPVDTLKNILYCDVQGSYCTIGLIQHSRQLQLELIWQISTEEFSSNLLTICLFCQEFIVPLKWDMKLKL